MFWWHDIDSEKINLNIINLRHEIHKMLFSSQIISDLFNEVMGSLL